MVESGMGLEEELWPIARERREAERPGTDDGGEEGKVCGSAVPAKLTMTGAGKRRSSHHHQQHLVTMTRCPPTV